MPKKIIKPLFRLLGLILFVSAVFCGMFKFTEITNEKNYMWNFYQLDKNSVDVLMIGSSHLHQSVNPVLMYESSGIAGYNLSGGSHSIWYSYHYLKEALKTQSPRLVVVDVYTVERTDYTRMTEMAASNLISMKWSLNKYEAVKSSEAKEPSDIFWTFPVFHGEYQKINIGDFSAKYTLNYRRITEVVPYEDAAAADMSAVTGIVQISPKQETYLRKTIELCRNEGINLLLINAPCPGIGKEHQERFNYIGEVAEEYGVPFINGCSLTEEIGLDYTADSADEGHLNDMGAAKWTRYLENYINTNYDLPDRRDDGRYGYWERCAQEYENLLLSENLAAETTFGGYFDSLTSHNCKTIEVLSLAGDYQSDGDKNAVISWGLSEEEYASGGVFIKRDREIVYSSLKNTGAYMYMDLGISTLAVETGKSPVNIYFNGNSIRQEPDAVNVYVISDVGFEILSQTAWKT